MVQKRVSRARKRDLEQPDRVTTFLYNLLDFAVRYKVHLSAALGLFVMLGITLAVMLYVANKSESKAFFLLGQGLNKYQSMLKKSSPEKAYLDVADDFKLIMQQYPRKAGGKFARYMYANLCYNAGNYDKAIELYNQALSDFVDNLFLKNLVLSSLGYAYEAKADYKLAATYFEMIVSEPDYPIKDEALFNLAKIYADMGNDDGRLNAFKKIVSDHRNSIYSEIAKERIPG